MGYDWLELDPQAREAWTLLGYTEETWDSGAGTSYDDMFWDQLPIEIRKKAADALCYSRELWNQEALNRWPSEHLVIPGMYELEPTTLETTADLPEEVVDENLSNNTQVHVHRPPVKKPQSFYIEEDEKDETESSGFSTRMGSSVISLLLSFSAIFFL